MRCCAPQAPSPILQLCMAANLRRPCDWLAHFGHPLELAETFVDPAQFGGTMYRAGNWIFVGRTARLRAQQRSLHRAPRVPQGDVPLLPGGPAHGCGLPSQLLGAPTPGWLLPMSRYPLCCSASPIIGHAPTRGGTGTGRLSGYQCASPVISRRVAQGGHYHPPSRATLHRAMTDTDPDALQAAHRWLAARAPGRTALAADGKRRRRRWQGAGAPLAPTVARDHPGRRPASPSVRTPLPPSGMASTNESLNPQVKQVFRIIRHRHTLKTGVDSREVAYGITSLSPEQADAKRLLAQSRALDHRERQPSLPRYHLAEDACLMHTRAAALPEGPAVRNLAVQRYGRG